MMRPRPSTPRVFALLFCNFVPAWATPEPQELTLPFELHANLPIVQVRVNGSGSRNFLLDSGANTPILNEALAQSLGLADPHLREAKVGAGEATARMGWAHNVTFRVGELTFPSRRVAIFPLNQIESRVGHEIDGVLGSAVFERYVVTLDYAASRITFHAPGSFVYRGSGQVLPLRLRGGRPFIDMRVTPIGAAPIDARTVIDTGDTSTVAFHTPFVEKHALRAATPKLVPYTSVGLSGPSRIWRGRLKSLELGTLFVDGPIASFSEAAGGSEADGGYDAVLGGEILRRFRLTLDYSRHQAIFEPNAALADPFEADMSGLVLAASGPDFRTLEVEHVDAGSPAADAGFQVHDKIETVDGRAAQEFSLQEAKRMLMQDGQRRSIEVRRGSSLVRLDLVLHRAL